MRWKKIFEGVIFFFTCFILPLRLIIWKFYPVAEPFEKSDLSNIIISVSILLLLCLFLAYKYFFKGFIQKSPLDRYLLGYLALVFLSITYSADQYLSLKAAIFLLAMIGYFYLILNVLSTPERLKIFIYLVIICGVITALWGFKDYVYLINRAPIPDGFNVTNENKSLVYVLSNKRVTSFLGWPNVLAGFLMLIIPISSVIVFESKKWLGKYIFVISTIVMLGAMVLTFSIGGWASFLIGSTLFWSVYCYKDKKLKLNRKNMALFLTAILTGAVVLGVIVVKRDIFSGANSIKPRIQYLHSALSMIKARPVVGHGFNTYQIVNRQYLKTKEGYSAFAHCSYLQVWAENGVIGLMALMLLIVFIYKKGIYFVIHSDSERKYRWLALGMLWSITIFLLDNMFSFTLIKPNISFYWWVVLALFCSILQMSEQRNSAINSAVSSGGYRNAVLIGLCLSIAGIFQLSKMYMGESYYYAGIRSFRSGNYPLTLENFKNAVKENSFDGKTHAALGQIYYYNSIKEKTKKYLPVAISETEIAISKMPVVYQNYITMGQILQLKGDVNLSKWNFDKARKLAPYK